MIFRVPIYVAAEKGGSFSARPLFFQSPERSDSNLNRLISKLARDVVRAIEEAGKRDRHDECARWSFSPALTQHRLDLVIELRRRKAKVKHLFVAFRHMGKRLAFTPAIPDLWFEVGRNADLKSRARDVLTDYWRTKERDDDEEVLPEADSLPGKAWVQTLELSAHPAVVKPKQSKFKFLSLGDESPPGGAAELQRVGRCLDWLYPDELDRAILRDAEVDELFRLLAARDRRPVLLVGPRQAGKTTVLHEVVYRRVAEKKSPFVNRDCVWLISPQRLISGMSYVGQWEARLLAILKHARKRHHVLYFDDMVGLFLAGISAVSTLSAAHVMKPYLERREVRVVGEITPEGLRVLQERDRAFADLFHILPVREPSDADTLRILIAAQRRLEGKHRCGFDLDVLPTVIDLQRRYERAAAFPGKAARMLTRLAVKADADQQAAGNSTAETKDPFAPTSTVTRDSVLTELHAQSGLSLAFLDRRARLDRHEILDALKSQVIGQDEAVEATADVIAVAKARLNDPDRPLAAFLFLGPTGVGKTETAKAVARYLFGDADRLLRFDMNEYVNSGSAARLVGTFDQPEGLLTAAIRRQPFAVVLLDEIEKADPEVFDLLLQVLGEGRLTDALGRTADFTNALVILTSNLGVREAEAQIGFREGGSAAAAAYTRAAEKFFRPEFFNRLDRVLPFRRLSRDHTRKIAERLVNEVLNREGFRQRKCVLNVTPAALDRVIDAGYDPTLGARAMKRSVERQLTQPAAARLSALPVDRFTVVNVYSETEFSGRPIGSPGDLQVDVRALEFAEPLSPRTDLDRPPIQRLEQLDSALSQIEESFANLRPAGAVFGRKVTQDQERYFVLRELADALGEDLDRLFDGYAHDRLARLEARQPDALGKKSRYRMIKPGAGPSWKEPYEQPARSLFAAQSMEEAIRELADRAEPEPGDADLLDVERRLALLRLMASAPPDDRPTYLWLRGHPSGAPCPATEQLAVMYLQGWADGVGVELETVKSPAGLAASDRLLLVKGLHARPLALTEAGTHLFCPAHGNVVPVRVEVLDQWPFHPADPFAFGAVLRTYLGGGSTIDMRTGLVAQTAGVADALGTFTLAGLAAGVRE
ncbi:MAG TPA: AAA family ATPase [Gemmataceae bacterium]|nr:AAA family ATPase [Gemmataceae bacterium]